MACNFITFTIYRLLGSRGTTEKVDRSIVVSHKIPPFPYFKGFASSFHFISKLLKIVIPVRPQSALQVVSLLGVAEDGPWVSLPRLELVRPLQPQQLP